MACGWETPRVLTDPTGPGLTKALDLHVLCTEPQGFHVLWASARLRAGKDMVILWKDVGHCDNFTLSLYIYIYNLTI